mgnify:CR=1 FL=1
MRIDLAEPSGSRAVPPQRAAEHGRQRFVTWRALALGAGLLPLNSYWLTWNVWHYQHITGGASLFSTAVFVICALLALNWLLGRWRPAAAFSPGELLVVYMMVTFGTTMCASGWDWMANLPTYLTYPFRFATEHNRWTENLLPLLPPWLVVSDPVAVRGFWEGQMTPYSRAVLGPWLRPILWWTSFVVALVWALFCLSSLLRRRWAEEEKMAFPIAQVPLELADPRGRVWRSRAFQIGAVGSGFLYLLGFVNSLVPAIPGPTFGFYYGQFTSRLPPWTGIRQPWLWYEPFLVGLSYLIPLDLLFSLWVFTVLVKVEQVLTVQLGWNTQTWVGPPYIDNQALGALLALVVMALWLDRGYLAALLRGALLGRGPLGDAREAMPHRLALLGIAAGVGYLAWFLLRMGIPGPVTAAFLGLLLLISLTLARVRAQLGPPHHEFTDAGPSQLMTMVLGSRAFGPRTQAAFTLLDPFTFSQRGNPAPLAIESLRMGQEQASLRGLAVPIVMAAAVGSISLFWANLHLHYPEGAGVRSHMAPAFVAYHEFASLDQRITQPTGGNWVALIATGGGAAAWVALMALKLRFPTFPLHPVALPVAIGSGIEGTVAAVFLAWTAKLAVLRWGGRGSYRISLALALGVIVGSSVASALVAFARQALITHGRL